MKKHDPIKLVLSDVDGTLLTSKKELTAGARSAIEELRRSGVLFTVTSGRPPRGMLQTLEDLHLDIPVAAFNGGMFFDPTSLPEIKVISEKLLPETVSREVIKKLEADGHEIWIYRKQDWYIRNADTPHVVKETSTVKFSPTVVPHFDGLYEGIVKIVGVSDAKEKLSSTQKSLSDEFEGRASASLSQAYYLDITHPEANKGEVVRFLSAQLGIMPKEIATLGDMPNDVSMFKESGLSFAMGNSDDSVKSAAVEVTDSYDDEGFAHALKKLIQDQYKEQAS